MKLVVFGASGSGTTTLGNEVAKRTGFVRLDVDDFYWEKTEPPFQEKRPLDKRNGS
jgi:adenylate kinase family enzyme